MPNMFGGRENLDAIAFMKRCNEVCYERFPGIATIAEESTSWPGVSKPTYTGGLGFGFKWNMGWMNDSLRYISKEPIYRRYHQGMITFSMVYAFHEHFVLVLSHDEVVHGKGSLHRKNAGRRVAEVRQRPDVPRVDVGASRQKAHLPGHRIRSMAGVEPQPESGLASRRKVRCTTDCAAWSSISIGSTRTSQLTTNLTIATKVLSGSIPTTAITASGPLCARGATRRSSSSSMPRRFFGEATALGVNAPGFYEEILNTDAETYGGSNVGNWGGRHAEHWGWQEKPYSILVDLPPLSVSGFKLVPPVSQIPTEL